MNERLFHVSHEPGITLFEPRPSPSKFDSITGDVVFAVTETLLHNYLLPRNCPRVTYYASPKTTKADKDHFFNHTSADYVIAVEASWYQQVKEAVLYCYEFSTASFTLLDECAGYFVSYDAVTPVNVVVITDVIAELLKRNIELRFMPDLHELAAAVAQSSLNFSLIRMRNAKSRQQ